MLKTCDKYPTLDSLRSYLLEHFYMHKIENFSNVAKAQKVVYDDTIE